MKILAEAGATKTDWRSLDSLGHMRKAQTGGINVSVMDADAIRAVVSDAMVQINPASEPVDEVCFYSAGMLGDEMSQFFDGARVECASDLLAAARAVLGRNAGVAAILGTGSNSCLYDGCRITANFRSGGFILGDEGSAASLGRLFLSDYIKGLVPEPLASEFENQFEVDYMTIVRNVYRGSAPSAYLGSFAPWILSRYDESQYVRDLVDGSIRSFFARALSRYASDALPVGLTGGFACACRDIILRIAQEFGITVTQIISSPMEGLIRYHGFGNE